MDTSFYLKSYTFFSLNLEMMFGKVTGDKAIAPSTDHMVHPTVFVSGEHLVRARKFSFL